ncbi:MbtH family NRPS accessory protein [Nocardia sp. NPDC003482]
MDDDDPPCYVLIDADGRPTVWPAFAAVPGGWTVAHGPAPRTDCLDYAETHWTALRLAALLAASRPEPT